MVMGQGWLGIVAGGLVLLGEPSLVSGGDIIRVEQTQAIASEPETIEFRGDQIRLNGRTIRGRWQVWRGAGELHIGVESMALEKSLGLRLADTSQAEFQGVDWFGMGDRLPVHFQNPYRYLDITTLATAAGWQWKAQGTVLELTVPVATLSGLRAGDQTWGKRVVIDLDRPVLWRQATPTTLELQGRLSGESVSNAAALPFKATAQDAITTLTFSAAIAPQIQVATLNDPPRLVIDLRKDAQPNRAIQWLPGVLWRQQNISLPSKNNGGFRVTWLEIDPTQNSLRLEPISPSKQTMVGLTTVLDQVTANGAIAGINAGFFNRNNYYALGAVRSNGQWRSSPILNRGVVAWDNEGNWAFNRLSFREDIRASNGETLTSDLLNSGYVKAGVARYTPAWGTTYKPITDYEVIVTVQDMSLNSPLTMPPTEKVTKQESAQKGGQGNYTIPWDGYLLVFRSFKSGAAKIPVGTTLERTEVLNPASFNAFPNVMGAGPLLVQNGQIVLNGAAEQFSSAFNYQSASRSAIARTRDGKIILATVHGTAAETTGATLREWADIMVRLGATDALNLDGGGSSSLAIGGDLGDRHAASVGRVNNGIGLFIDHP